MAGAASALRRSHLRLRAPHVERQPDRQRHRTAPRTAAQRPRQHRVAFARRAGRRSRLVDVGQHGSSRAFRPQGSRTAAGRCTRSPATGTAHRTDCGEATSDRALRALRFPISRHAARRGEHRHIPVGAHQSRRPDSGGGRNSALRGDQADSSGDHPDPDRAIAGARTRSDDAAVAAGRAAQQPRMLRRSARWA